MTPSLENYLILSGVLFAIGTAGVFIRRNLITILLSIEIMLNAVNLSFVAFGRALGAAGPATRGRRAPDPRPYLPGARSTASPRTGTEP